MISDDHSAVLFRRGLAGNDDAKWLHVAPPSR